MEFASDYVYRYNESDEESVSDEEYGTVMEVSCNPLRQLPPVPASTGPIETSSPSEGGAASAGREPSHKRSKIHKWMSPETASAEGSSADAAGSSSSSGARTKSGEGKKWRRADTNIVAVKFDQLTKPSNMHTGDAVSCKQCHAMLSHVSKLTDQTDDKVWCCEFCNESNVVDILPGEIPAHPDITYMIKASPVTNATSCQGVEDSIVVFCIDVSGSMSCPVGNKSRLECVKAAVLQQLRELSTDHPTRKVALVTFESKVTIIGDGKMKAVTVSEDAALGNFDSLAGVGSQVDTPGSISSTYELLKQQVLGLNDAGSTALGPALLVSIMMASKSVASKVIICTDGEANVGLGSLGTSQYEAASIFYRQLGEKARSLGVSVSVLTVIGTECKLVELGEVARASGGQVNIVDPRKLSQELGSIFVDTVIACQVEATFIIHRGLYIRGESDLTSYVKRNIGNVTKDTEITFEFGVRTVTNSDGEAGAASDSPAELPFQVQIKYTDLDGAEAVRVLTQVLPVTTDRQQAEKSVKVPIIGIHVAKQAADFALKGDYKPSRLNTFMYQRLVARNADDQNYRAYMSEVVPLQNDILRNQEREARVTGASVDCYEDLYDDDMSHQGQRGLGSKLGVYYKKKSGPIGMSSRRNMCTDVFSNNVYANIHKNSKHFSRDTDCD